MSAYQVWACATSASTGRAPWPGRWTASPARRRSAPGRSRIPPAPTGRIPGPAIGPVEGPRSPKQRTSTPSRWARARDELIDHDARAAVDVRRILAGEHEDLHAGVGAAAVVRSRPLRRGRRVVARRLGLLEALELARDRAGIDAEELGRQGLVPARDAQGLVEQLLLDLGQRGPDAHGQHALRGSAWRPRPPREDRGRRSTPRAPGPRRARRRSPARARCPATSRPPAAGGRPR